MEKVTSASSARDSADGAEVGVLDAMLLAPLPPPYGFVAGVEFVLRAAQVDGQKVRGGQEDIAQVAMKHWGLWIQKSSFKNGW